MKKSLVLTAALAVVLAACIPSPVVVPTIHIETPSASVASSLSLDERIAIQDAWTALSQGRTDKAEEIFAKLKPDNPFVLAGRGYIALMANNLSTGEDFLVRAIEVQPDLTLAYLGLGQTYQKNGQLEPAYKAYLEVLKREPDNAFAKGEAARIANGKTEEALSEAGAAEAAGQTDKAREAYLRALEYSPKLQAAHLALAKIYAKQKDYASALLHLKTATANDPRNPALLADYADALFQSGQWSRGLDAYEQIAALDPQDKTAKDRIEQIKNRLGVVDLPDQFGAIAASEAVTKEDVAALVGVKFREALSDLNPKPPVIVDITTSWAQRYIVKAAALEIMEVYSNHTFQPKKPVNRAELADALVRLVDVLKKNGAKIYPQIPLDRVRIADVPQEHFLFMPIAQALSYGVMELLPDRSFKPELPVSGAEALKAFDLLAGLVK